MPLERLTEPTAEVAEDAEKASKRGRNSFSRLCALRVLGGESVLLGALTMESDYSTCPPFDDEAEQEEAAAAEEEGARLDEVFALDCPPSDRTVRRDHQRLEQGRDEWAEARQTSRETYEHDLIGLLKPQGPLQCALVRHLAGALARYESIEALETALQRRFFVLSLGRPAQVLLDVSVWQKYAQHSPRLRKSLQSGILKLIHEIERLRANAAAEKGHPVHVLDSNSG